MYGSRSRRSASEMRRFLLDFRQLAQLYNYFERARLITVSVSTTA